MPNQIVNFQGGGGFYETVKQRVDEYFDARQLSKHGGWKMFWKIVIILELMVTSYTVLILFSPTLWIAIPAACTLAMSFALIGFCIQHGANHGGLSKNKKINYLLGFTLDLIGGSSWFWRVKHNILHHTYTNVFTEEHKLDNDLGTEPMLRLSPHQKWRSWHRFQHFYAWPLYCFVSLMWVAVNDFRKYVSGKIENYKLPKQPAREQILFFGGKLLYVGYMLVIPMFFHAPLTVIAFFFAIHALTGFTLGIVFQLAHTVEENEFPVPKHNGNMESFWAEHEVRTTANFSPKSGSAAWALGGLNYQIEHHLFPRVSDIHYPRISNIVKMVCAEFNLPYTSHRNFFTALRAHYRYLKQLSRRSPELMV